MGRTRQLEAQITGRQREVLDLVARGHTNGEIAEALGISLDGAKWHVSELLTRFGAESRDALADAWIHERRPMHRTSEGIRRFFGALTIGLAKPAVAVAASGAALVAGVGVTVAVLASAGSESAPQSLATATPFVAPTLPPRPAGSIWAPDEALAKAQSVAAEKMADWITRYFDTPVVPAALALQEAE